MPFKQRPYFTAEWQAGLAKARQPFMPTTVRIFDQGKGVYDPATNKYTYPNLTVVYEGEARVQPIRSTQSRILPQDNTTVQTVLFMIPLLEVQDVDFRPGLQARVTSAPLFPGVEGYQYVLREVTDAGNAVERTLVFTVDQEMVVNGV